MTVPHVGRYRLFQRALAGPLWTCRVCRESFKRENLDRHRETEVQRHREGLERVVGVVHLEVRLAFLMRARRSRRNLRRARWEYAVGRSKAR